MIVFLLIIFLLIISIAKFGECPTKGIFLEYKTSILIFFFFLFEINFVLPLKDIHSFKFLKLETVADKPINTNFLFIELSLLKLKDN